VYKSDKTLYYAATFDTFFDIQDMLAYDKSDFMFKEFRAAERLQQLELTVEEVVLLMGISILSPGIE